jgi:hypothetical protein
MVAKHRPRRERPGEFQKGRRIVGRARFPGSVPLNRHMPGGRITPALFGHSDFIFPGPVRDEDNHIITLRPRAQWAAIPALHASKSFGLFGGALNKFDALIFDAPGPFSTRRGGHHGGAADRPRGHGRIHVITRCIYYRFPERGHG